MIRTAKTITQFSRVYDLILLWLIVFSIQFTVTPGGARISLSLAVANLGINVSIDMFSSPFHK
jgi:hypothetical protein